MVANKVQKEALIYCKECHSRNSWQRHPERDSHYFTGEIANPIIGEIYEYAYKCCLCGAVTLRPYEPELK